MNFDAFSHGQVKSKLWLCEKLEPHIPNNTKVLIYGCWYNILGFMLLTRNYNLYKQITGIDIDEEAIQIADQFCNAFIIDNIVNNISIDANTVDYDWYDVYINCSPEHMVSNDWFDNIPDNKLVCIQSSDITEPEYPWLIKTPSRNIEEFKNRYKLRSVLFLDTLPITYETWGYNRFMIIGIK